MTKQSRNLATALWIAAFAPLSRNDDFIFIVFIMLRYSHLRLYQHSPVHGWHCVSKLV